jgi:hypothetical protein
MKCYRGKKQFFVTKQNLVGRIGGQSFVTIFEKKKTSNLGLRFVKFGH